MKPVVSVITPTFNHEEYIEDCIRSVLRQTFPDWEMIIIDDGSTDNTPSLIQRFDDPRVIYLYESHRGIEGLGENYNYALGLSKGEFIIILEGDDYIPPNRIQIQISAFRDQRVILSHGRYAYIFDKRMFLSSMLWKKDILNNQPVGLALKAFLQGINPIGTQSVMIRKSTLVEIGGFTQPEYLPLVDYPTWMKLALKGEFHFIPEVLGYWRRHSSSVTMNKSEDILDGYLTYCDEFIHSFRGQLLELHLNKFMNHRGAIVFLSLAWIKISNKHWRDSLLLIKKSWQYRDTLDWLGKIKVMISMISVLLHLDLPLFFKKLGYAILTVSRCNRK